LVENDKIKDAQKLVETEERKFEGFLTALVEARARMRECEQAVEESKVALRDDVQSRKNLKKFKKQLEYRRYAIAVSEYDERLDQNESSTATAGPEPERPTEQQSTNLLEEIKELKPREKKLQALYQSTKALLEKVKTAEALDSRKREVDKAQKAVGKAASKLKSQGNKLAIEKGKLAILEIDAETELRVREAIEGDLTAQQKLVNSMKEDEQKEDTFELDGAAKSERRLMASTNLSEPSVSAFASSSPSTAITGVSPLTTGVISMGIFAFGYLLYRIVKRRSKPSKPVESNERREPEPEPELLSIIIEDKSQDSPAEVSVEIL